MGADIRVNAYGRAPIDIAEYLKHSPKTAAKADAASGSRTEEQKKDAASLEKIASDVQIYLKRLNTELRFEVNKDLKEVVIKVVDPKTDEVIRQIPSEEAINLRKRMEDLIGVLYSAKT